MAIDRNLDGANDSDSSIPSEGHALKNHINNNLLFRITRVSQDISVVLKGKSDTEKLAELHQRALDVINMTLDIVPSAEYLMKKYEDSIDRGGKRADILNNDFVEAFTNGVDLAIRAGLMGMKHQLTVFRNIDSLLDDVRQLLGFLGGEIDGSPSDSHGTHLQNALIHLRVIAEQLEKVRSN